MNLLILFCPAIVKGKKKICYDNVVLNPVKKSLLYTICVMIKILIMVIMIHQQ